MENINDEWYQEGKIEHLARPWLNGLPEWKWPYTHAADMVTLLIVIMQRKGIELQTLR